MSFSNLLNQAGSITRQGGGSSDSGVAIRTYALVASGVPCALQRPSGGIRQEDAGKVSTAVWRAFLEADADLREHDRFVCEGTTYEVSTVENLRGHHLEADLRRVMA